MSKHWRPDDDKIVPIGRDRNWARASNYVPPRGRRSAAGPSGVVVGVVLAAAACAGIAIGLSRGSAGGSDQPSAAIEWDAVQAVPKAELSQEDRAWAGRATGSARIGSAASDWAPDQFRGDEVGVRRAFGLCHSGGGTNCVIDGDTFYLGGDKVRIAGIDAPETHPPRCAEEAQLGDAATEKLRALLNSGAVTMTSIERPGCLWTAAAACGGRWRGRR